MGTHQSRLANHVKESNAGVAAAGSTPAMGSEVVCVVTTIVLHSAADGPHLVERCNSVIRVLQQLKGCLQCCLSKEGADDDLVTFALLEVWSSLKVLEDHWQQQRFPDFVLWVREKAAVDLSFPAMSELGHLWNEAQTDSASPSRRRALLNSKQIQQA